jgi:hypothetical protein
MPVEIVIAEAFHAKIYADNLKFVPLSNDNISKLVGEISDDMREQMLDGMETI